MTISQALTLESEVNMSLNKAIKYGKEKRKPYRRGKKYSKSCRNHGSCKWCSSNRLFANKKKEESMREQVPNDKNLSSFSGLLQKEQIFKLFAESSMPQTNKFWESLKNSHDIFDEPYKSEEKLAVLKDAEEYIKENNLMLTKEELMEGYYSVI